MRGGEGNKKLPSQSFVWWWSFTHGHIPPNLGSRVGREHLQVQRELLVRCKKERGKKRGETKKMERFTVASGSDSKTK